MKAVCIKRCGPVHVGDIVDVEQYECYNNIGYRVNCGKVPFMMSEELFEERFNVEEKEKKQEYEGEVL